MRWRPDRFFGAGQEKQKYQESHTKVSQVFEFIQNLSALSERPVSSETENSNRFKLKSLILAQIERWRHALHMQVERQHGCLHLVASGERVSNTSERAQSWGITQRKLC